MSMWRRIWGGVLFSLLLLTLVGSVRAQEDDAVVFGVLFYLPTCSHCHYVITEVVPEWEAEFGDSFQLLYVDASQETGSELFSATCLKLRVANCGSVPMLVIGDRVMVGSGEIPERTPGIVRNGLSKGGIGLPDVPALRAAYESVVGQSGDGDVSGNTSDVGSDGGIELAATSETSTLADRLAADPVANALAVVVLSGLLLSIGAVFWLGNQDLLQATPIVRYAAIATAVLGVAAAFSLAINSDGDTLATVLSWGALVLLGIAVAMLVASYDTNLILPLIMLAGLGVAFYLAQIEVTESEAVCGTVGHCNEVQESEFARLFGIIPIGVLGMVGYVGMLLAWAVVRFRPDQTVVGQASLFGMALFGTVFSAYLTFLEPFVIGATCAWCITSALTMLMLFWLVAPEGWVALQSLMNPQNSTPKRV